MRRKYKWILPKYMLSSSVVEIFFFVHFSFKNFLLSKIYEKVLGESSFKT